MRNEHGRCQALGGKQVIALGGSAGLAGGFYVVAVLYLPRVMLAVLAGLYSLALLGTFLCALKCTIIDSGDLGSTHKEMVVPFTDFPKYCALCRSRVGARSTHCQKCGRCTAGFDHHCDWLNVCIGHANYHWFFALICCVEVDLLLQTIVLGTVLANKNRSAGEIAGFALGIILNVMLSLIFLYIVAFHVYISLRGLTTFEYMSLRAIKVHTAPLYNGKASQLSINQSANELSVLAPPCSLQLPMDGNMPDSEASSAQFPKAETKSMSPQDAVLP